MTMGSSMRNVRPSSAHSCVTRVVTSTRYVWLTQWQCWWSAISATYQSTMRGQRLDGAMSCATRAASLANRARQLHWRRHMSVASAVNRPFMRSQRRYGDMLMHDARGQSGQLRAALASAPPYGRHLCGQSATFKSCFPCRQFALFPRSREVHDARPCQQTYVWRHAGARRGPAEGSIPSVVQHVRSLPCMCWIPYECPAVVVGRACRRDLWASPMAHAMALTWDTFSSRWRMFTRARGVRGPTSTWGDLR